VAFTTVVDSATLAAHLADPDWVVFDCRFDLSKPDAGQRAYAEAHIPGARYAHLDNDLSSPITATSGRHPLPDAQLLAEKLGRWGVGGRTQVVAYDGGAGAVAARLWWLLRWLGHEAVAVLDGGLAKWQKEQRPLTNDAPTITPAVFEVTIDQSLWVPTSIVEQSLTQDSHLVLDARAVPRFKGAVEPIDKVAGHIPGAVNRPFDNNVDAQGCFLARDVLRSQFQELLQGREPAQVINMCGSGVTACHNILAMERAGLFGAKLYPGSWSEWIRDSRRPVIKEA
jgi:thiosulfate/3-mercaptopyruvate sulfurtransferase